MHEIIINGLIRYMTIYCLTRKHLHLLDCVGTRIPSVWGFLNYRVKRRNYVRMQANPSSLRPNLGEALGQVDMLSLTPESHSYKSLQKERNKAIKSFD